jgi:hypothetical protein
MVCQLGFLTEEKTQKQAKTATSQAQISCLEQKWILTSERNKVLARIPPRIRFESARAKNKNHWKSGKSPWCQEENTSAESSGGALSKVRCKQWVTQKTT